MNEVNDVPVEYGIDNIKSAIGPATNLIESVIDLASKKFTLINVVNALTGIVLNYGVYKKVIETRAQLILEFKDLRPGESLQLAEAFKQEFDIADDVREEKVEELILAAATFYGQIDLFLPEAKDLIGGDYGTADRIRKAGDVVKQATELIAWAIDVVNDLGFLIKQKDVKPVAAVVDDFDGLGKDFQAITFEAIDGKPEEFGLVAPMPEKSDRSKYRIVKK